MKNYATIFEVIEGCTSLVIDPIGNRPTILYRIRERPVLLKVSYYFILYHIVKS
jgi:hypothetical protein